MSGISKRVSGSWVSGDYGIMKTSTDTITTLPANLYADGNNATVGISGNMVQTGTPTPQNPIQPQECGDLETVGEKAGQYKIPILSASTTTPVYLGEVESTRKIKKLVLTYEGSWVYYGTFGVYNHKHFYIDLGGFTTIPMTNDILLCCNTYAATNNVNNIGNYCCRYQQTSGNNWNINRIYFTNDDYNSLDDVITALRNNPIILYIIAAQETTGIVNEPLRKIGDYADEVSGITIPTIAGANTLSVDTTLQPSEVTATYRGWHPVADVHERDNGAWT